MARIVWQVDVVGMTIDYYGRGKSDGEKSLVKRTTEGQHRRSSQ
jgi:hypothetical protein